MDYYMKTVEMRYAVCEVIITEGCKPASTTLAKFQHLKEAFTFVRAHFGEVLSQENFSNETRFTYKLEIFDQEENKRLYGLLFGKE